MDLLIILDMSNSIENKALTPIRKFLKKVINSPMLNVGPHGTHVGLMTFAEKKNLLFKVGEKTKPEMEDVIDDLKFNKHTGKETRTDLALNMTNNEVRKQMIGVTFSPKQA